jgi:hypothetical protein
MLFATSLLALSLTNAPAQPCITPTQTGIFRITATTKDSSDASVGLVLLESVGNCLEASIIADEGGPAIIDRLALKDDVITGRVRLRSGVAEVSLRVSALNISGSINAAKKSWIVTGRRTTGAELRSADGDVAPTKTPARTP